VYVQATIEAFRMGGQASRVVSREVRRRGLAKKGGGEERRRGGSLGKVLNRVGERRGGEGREMDTAGSTKGRAHILACLQQSLSGSSKSAHPRL